MEMLRKITLNIKQWPDSYISGYDYELQNLVSDFMFYTKISISGSLSCYLTE